MRIENALLYNPHQLDGDQIEIKQGTDAPDTTNFFTKMVVGSLYVRRVAEGHVQVYQKVNDNNRADDFACLSGVIQQRVTVADFTDGGAAVGTLALTNQIPIGAIADEMSVLNVTEFAGDTSAVLTVGDGTDVDRYNTGTPSIFATATAIAIGVPSGTRHHTAAATVTLTVTSATDFTAVVTNGSGAMTVRIPYHF